MPHAAKLRTLVSLFTGAGGLDLGLEAAGFEPRLCVEVDGDAMQTIKTNRGSWPIADPGDVHILGAEGVRRQSGLKPKELDLLAGGPPCQPFSKSAYWHRGDTSRLDDPRAKTLQAYLAIVEKLQPRVILLENVRGIGYRSKSEGLMALASELVKINGRVGTAYDPGVHVLNAADYGVPQFRERVFLVAHRSGEKFIPPAASHGPRVGQPYVTAWDAIGDLVGGDTEDLRARGKWSELLPSIPEGANYLWHTPSGGGRPLFGWRTRYWSFLLKLAKDRPAWTIQATPGPATGPFHWENRLLSIRELCRLQTFPDDYAITGDRRAAHRQIGNAVPCLLAERMGRAIQHQFFGRTTDAEFRYTIARRPNCPSPERRRPVPRAFDSLRAEHAPHPGTGRGPGATRRLGQ